MLCEDGGFQFNPVALRKAKIVYNFGLSDCNRVKVSSERWQECKIEQAVPGLVA